MSQGGLDSLGRFPFTVPVAGKPRRVYEATLSDLAELQHWLNGRRGDPYQELTGQLAAAALSGDERKRLIRDAYDRASAEPVDLFGGEARALLSAGRGACRFLWVALRKGHPRLTPRKAVRLYAAATPAELEGVSMAFYRADPAKLIEAMRYPPELLALAATDQGEAAAWEKVVYGVARRLRVSIDEVMAMTLGQFGCARRRGEPARTAGLRFPPENMAEVERIWAEHEGLTLPERPRPASLDDARNAEWAERLGLETAEDGTMQPDPAAVALWKAAKAAKDEAARGGLLPTPEN